MEKNKAVDVSDRDWKNARNGRGAAMTLQFTGEGGLIDNGGHNITSTSESSLAHELVHMFDFDQGTIAKGNPYRVQDIVTGEAAGLKRHEVPAVQYENLVRDRLGLALRHSYHIMERNSNGTIGKDPAVPNHDILIKNK